MSYQELSEYLRSEQARAVLKELLDPDCPVDEDGDRIIETGHGAWWCLDSTKPKMYRAWSLITVCYKKGAGFNVWGDTDVDGVQCYVRFDSTPIVVSDCGETVRAVMKDNGRRWEENVAMAKKSTDLIGGTNAGDIRQTAIHGADSLILNVLTAISNVMAAGISS